MGQRAGVDLRERIARRSRLIAEGVGRKPAIVLAIDVVHADRQVREQFVLHPTTASRVRAICVPGSTALPAGANTPVEVLNRALLEVGMPVSSLAWTTPSMLASVQHDVPVQVPLLALDPNVRLVTGTVR